GLYVPAQKIAYRASKEGFRAATAIGRQFAAVQKLVQPQRLPSRKPSELFDLTVGEEQQMFRDMAQRFAREVMRPAAAASDHACELPDEFAAQVGELGLAQFAVPEALGGAATESSAVAQVLVAED